MQKSEVLSTEVVAESHWLRLERVQYRCARGKFRSWDRCVRTPAANRQEMVKGGIAYRRSELLADAAVTVERSVEPETGRPPDAATIIALTYHSQEKRGRQENLLEMDEMGILLVRQFRPPVGCACIEFPAGMVDPGETAEEAARRELREETGFVLSRVLHRSPTLVLSPGATNESTVNILALVDLDEPQNTNPRQMLEEAEEIEVIHIPLKDLHSKLHEEAEKGNSVFSEVYAMAMALKFLPGVQI